MEEVWVVHFESETRNVFVYRDVDRAREFAERAWAAAAKSSDAVSWRWVESMERWELYRTRYGVADVTVERETVL